MKSNNEKVYYKHFGTVEQEKPDILSERWPPRRPVHLRPPEGASRLQRGRGGGRGAGAQLRAQQGGKKTIILIF